MLHKIEPLTALWWGCNWHRQVSWQFSKSIHPLRWPVSNSPTH